MIERFSEDIDLFLAPLAFKPALGKKAIDRELKKLRDAIARHPSLTFIADESQTIGGFGRSDRLSYVQKFAGPGEVANRVLLESGTATLAPRPRLARRRFFSPRACVPPVRTDLTLSEFGSAIRFCRRKLSISNC
ncbi:MAG: nucleotidyl transferase AbiEii/AbiGii toxin family protein [Planctomycetaceae bacterium]|nr:nucleotidyl transferase AbiEii/AbiGii toxin family protein [Planctomycetaceae bacterium]